MKKSYICVVLMIAAAALVFFTLAKITRQFPAEYYIGKVWVMDYGGWDIVAANNHISFCISYLEDGKIEGYFVTGKQAGKVGFAGPWYDHGIFSGTVEDGMADCSFVIEPDLPEWYDGVDVEARLTFEADGRLGLAFSPSGTESRLLYHESYQRYRAYNISDIDEIAPYIEDAKMFPADTGFGEAEFIFAAAEEVSILGRIETVAYLINKEQEIFFDFSLRASPDGIKDVRAEDINGDGRTDIVITGYALRVKQDGTMGNVDYQWVYSQQEKGLFVEEFDVSLDK